MKKNKYKIKFYTIKGATFTRICTRTYSSTLKLAIKTAIKQCAIFTIVKLNKNDSKRII